MKPKQNEPKFPYFDDVTVSETFVDSFHTAMCGNGIVRIELGVKRYAEIRPPHPPSGKVKTAARLVMPVEFLPELYNQLTKIVEALGQQGVLKRGEEPTRPANLN